jgi:hypothetical protein
MVYLRNISVDTPHKGDTEDKKNNKTCEICGSYIDVNENAIHPGMM